MFLLVEALIRREKKNELFSRWPEEDGDGLFKVMDLEILLDTINYIDPYTKTTEFYGDVKFIYHNSCIKYGANSDQAKAAENLRRDFKNELLDLEACPECYYHMYCEESDRYDSFIRLCDSPHDIVWAQLTGHPYWPAKCLKVIKGIAHVKFFGEHEQSNISIKKCLFMSKSHPKYKNSNIYSPENSGPKSDQYRSAIRELLSYILLYERKYGDFPFYPFKTPYKPQEKENEVVIMSTEGSSSRNVVQMKMEGFVNEDPEANVINAATVIDFSEDNLTFPNSVTNDTRSPNGTIIGNPSPVTSINMSFSTDDNSSNVPAHPVVSSIESLEHADSPVVLPTGDKNMSCDFRIFESLKGIISPNGSKENNSTSHDESPVQPIALQNIISNFAYTGNQAELDNEVECIGQKNNAPGEILNPNIILPFIEESCPELMARARYLIDSLIINLWATCNRNPDSLGRISKMCVELRKCKSALKKMEEENVKFKKEDAENKYQIQSLTDQLKELEAEKKNLQNQVQEEIARGTEATENAKTIIMSLKTGCYRKIEKTLKKQFMETITEKEKKLEDAERIKKSLEEEKRQLEKELEEAKIAKKNAEEKLKITKSQESVYDRDEIESFKKMHYCKVCETPAAVTCCLNTSYCGQECLEYHAKQHQPDCEKRNFSSKIVKQTVCKETFSLSYAEMSTINASNSQEISATNSMESTTHHKKTETSSSILPTPHDSVTISSSRASSSKSKRRIHR